MKKWVFIIAVCITVVTIASYGVNTSLNRMRTPLFSDLTKANIEALSGFEGGGTEIGPAPDGERYGCVYDITYGGVGFVRDCVTCEWAYFISNYAGISSCYEH